MTEHQRKISKGKENFQTDVPAGYYLYSVYYSLTSFMFLTFPPSLSDRFVYLKCRCHRICFKHNRISHVDFPLESSRCAGSAEWRICFLCTRCVWRANCYLLNNQPASGFRGWGKERALISPLTHSNPRACLAAWDVMTPMVSHVCRDAGWRTTLGCSVLRQHPSEALQPFAGQAPERLPRVPFRFFLVPIPRLCPCSLHCHTALSTSWRAVPLTHIQASSFWLSFGVCCSSAWNLLPSCPVWISSVSSMSQPSCPSLELQKWRPPLLHRTLVVSTLIAFISQFLLGFLRTGLEKK